MSLKESVINGAVRSDHIAQLFDCRESLAESVSTFLIEAYDEGDNLLVVARTRHWNAITAELDARGFDQRAADVCGRLVVLDADATLPAILRMGRPDPRLFDGVIGTLVRRLCRKGGLSIYGELVEVLAEQAEFDAATALEGLWNALGERCSFRLLCGYSSPHFVSLAGASAFQNICRAHARVERKDDDLLAGWLLTSHATL